MIFYNLIQTMENSKSFTILGIVAPGTAVTMYVSYLPKISSNLDGIKGISCSK